MRRGRIPRLLQGPRALFGLCLGLYLLHIYVRDGQQQRHIQPELRDEVAKLREQMSAQNEMIKKLQDQDRDLQSEIDKMQDDLHGCRTESGKHGELLQGLERSLENYEGQISNLRYSLENCRSQSWKSQVDKIWWPILLFGLGCFLGCFLGCCRDFCSK